MRVRAGRAGFVVVAVSALVCSLAVDAVGADDTGVSAELSRLPATASQAVLVEAPNSASTTATVSAWQRTVAGSWSRGLGPVAAHLGTDHHAGAHA